MSVDWLLIGVHRIICHCRLALATFHPFSSFYSDIPLSLLHFIIPISPSSHSNFLLSLSTYSFHSLHLLPSLTFSLSTFSLSPLSAPVALYAAKGFSVLFFLISENQPFPTNCKEPASHVMFGQACELAEVLVIATLYPCCIAFRPILRVYSKRSLPSWVTMLCIWDDFFVVRDQISFNNPRLVS